MPKHIITLIVALGSIWFIAAAIDRATPPRTVEAQQSISVTADRSVTASFQSAAIYTTYFPIIVNCYPLRIITDPGFASQPDMTLINADWAWQHCVTGSPNIVVAVIDTGVNLNHPDLTPNVISGYDFVDYDTVAQDGNGHGSNVAGIIGAALNGVGVVGVAPSTHILPVRVLDDSGSGYTSDVAAGIEFAADHAQILNLSLGGAFDDYFIHTAFDYAVNTQHRLVAAAAGNCGNNSYSLNGCSSQNQYVYPGAYSIDYPGGVIAVGAVSNDNSHASFSNSDPYVTVAAPGVGIYSDYLSSGYVSETGTSQATPHVAGLAALIWAKHPEYTAAQVEYAITSTAVDLGSIGKDNDFGWGRIDVQAALNSIGALSISSMDAAHPTNLVQPVDHRDAKIAAGRVLIKFKSGVTATGVNQALSSIGNLKIEKEIEHIGVKVLSVPIGQEWKMIDRLRTLANVEFVEPDYAVQLIP